MPSLLLKVAGRVSPYIEPKHIRVVNRALAATSFILFLLALADLTVNHRKLELPQKNSKAYTPIYPGTNSVGLDSNDRSALSDELVQKLQNSEHLFASQSSDNQNDVQKQSRSESIGQWKLLGVISGENPQAVLEQVDTKSTYYLAKGERVGNMIVQDVTDKNVIIEVSGQKKALEL